MKFDPSHNTDIINFYYTNYSTCPKDTNYFATWQFLATFCHSVLIIQVPLVVLTSYCILKKTPKEMGSLKWAMLNAHFWCTNMDVFVCSLATPYLFFPALGGFSVGLLAVLKVPPVVELYLGLASLGFMINSITAVFENRSSSFEMNRFRFERTQTRLAFFILHGVLFSAILLPLFFLIPEQASSKFRILQGLECPTKEFFTFPIFIFMIDSDLSHFFTILIGVQWTIAFGTAMFFILCTAYYMFYSGHNVHSSKTKNLQKMFYIGSLIQILIPSVTWVVPGVSLCVFYFINYRSQEFNNISVAVVSLHGVISMIAFLIIHHPYRTYVKSLFGFGKVMPLVSNSFVLP